jgi:flavin-dependent dehydrogenase
VPERVFPAARKKGTVMSEPIEIVGAGPAGLTAAIVLARNGYPVRVFEMAADVGHRLNGDFQGLENWSTEQDTADLLAECGLEINFLCEPFYEGTILAPGISPAAIHSDRPIFYLVKRGAFPGSLDIGLKEQALAAGVEIIFNRRWEAGRGGGIVGTGPRGVDILAAGVTFTTSMADRALVVFDDAIAPKGYAYLLVHRGSGTLATVMYRDFNREKECFAATERLFRNMADVDIREPQRFTSYGNFFIRNSQVNDNSLYVGESAGFQDGLWGFGLRYAVLSGYLAARSIITGDDYDDLWKKHLKPMLETSMVNRFLLERWGHAGYRYLARKLARGNPCAYLRRHYNRSFCKGLLLPLAKAGYSRRRDRGKDLSVSLR